MSQTIRIQRQPKPVMQSPISRADHPGRVWGGRQSTSGVPPCMLPRTHPKYRPAPGSKKFSDGPRATKPDQAWKYYDTHLGKYIYALSRPKGKAGKGWVKG